MPVRDATPADIAAWRDKGALGPCECDILEAIVVETAEGKQLGLAGLYNDDGLVVAFSAWSEELLRRKRDIVAAVRRVRGMMTKHPHVVAVAVEGIPASRTWLAFVGFEHAVDDVYVWRSYGG